MSAATVSSASRGFVTASAVFFVLWQIATVAGFSRRTLLALAIYGFVLHVVFGKAYSLVPAYFDRELAFTRAPFLQLPLSVAGTICLAAVPLAAVPDVIGAVGAILWATAVVIFLGTIGWTVRDNLTGRETGTGEVNVHRRTVDRVANAFIPLALAYLAIGSYETVAMTTGLPPVFDGYPPRTSHLLAAGTAGLLVLAIGFRLLPRFMAATPPTPLVAVVLPAGAIGPALIANGIGGGRWLLAGSILQTIAVVGFAVAVAVLFRRSERRRIGFYGVLCGAIAGVLGVAIGLHFAVGSLDAGLLEAHRRLNLVGFLGLTIVGVAYQFYPPGIGTLPGVGDRTGLASIGFLAGGLGVEVVGLVSGTASVVAAGRIGVLLGSALFAYLVIGLFYERHWRRER